MVDSKKGTTTLGILCSKGVVLASDKRASLGHLAYAKVEKTYKITDNIAITIAGSVADAYMLKKFLTSQMELYRLNKEQEPTVEVANNMLANVMFSGSKSFAPYLNMFLVAGKSKDGWKLYSMDPSGASEPTPFIATGSGMELALGVLEANYKDGISIEEGLKLALLAMKSAIRRDVATGEGVDLSVIDAKGFRKVKTEKFKDLLRD